MQGLFASFFGVAGIVLILYRNGMEAGDVFRSFASLTALIPLLPGLAIVFFWRKDQAKKALYLRLWVDAVWIGSFALTLTNIALFIVRVKSAALADTADSLASGVLVPFFTLFIQILIFSPQITMAEILSLEENIEPSSSIRTFLPVLFAFSLLIVFFILFGGTPRTTARPEDIPDWKGPSLDPISAIFTLSMGIIFFAMLGLLKGYGHIALWSGAALWSAGFACLLLDLEFLHMLKQAKWYNLDAVALSLSHMLGLAILALGSAATGWATCSAWFLRKRFAFPLAKG